MKTKRDFIYISLLQVVLLLCLFVVLTLVITVTQGLICGTVNSPLLNFCRTISVDSIIVIAVYLVSGKNSKFLVSPFKKIDVTICLWIVPLGILFFFFMIGMIMLVLLFMEPYIGKVPHSIYSIHTYTFISSVCVTPLFEEWLFRGIILNSFLKRYSFFRAMCLSVLLFALLHGGLQVLTAAFLGILAGYLYYSTRSIWPGIILHGTNNFCAYLWLYMTDKIQSNIPSNVDSSTGETFFIIGGLWIVVAVVFLLILYHFLPILKSKYNSSIHCEQYLH